MLLVQFVPVFLLICKCVVRRRMMEWNEIVDILGYVTHILVHVLLIILPVSYFLFVAGSSDAYMNNENIDTFIPIEFYQ